MLAMLRRNAVPVVTPESTIAIAGVVADVGRAEIPAEACQTCGGTTTASWTTGASGVTEITPGCATSESSCAPVTSTASPWMTVYVFETLPSLPPLPSLSSPSTATTGD